MNQSTSTICQSEKSNPDVQSGSAIQTEQRPLVTFALFAYNQEKYIREAVDGAFSQTYDPLEIILSDDCSTDRTFEIMQEMVAEYKGSHQIILNKNTVNIGLAGHINKIMQIASGCLIVVAAGDDISDAFRTMTIVKQWVMNGKNSGSIYSHFRTISEDEVITPPIKRCKSFIVSLADRNIQMLNDFSGISGCTHAWTKDIFEIFGPINEHIVHEDIIIPLRALLIGKIAFISEDLVDYRLTKGSITRKLYANSRERIDKMRKYCYGRVAVFEQFEKDVIVARSKGLTNIEKLEWLCGEVNKAKKYALLQHELYSADSSRRLLLVLNPFTDMSFNSRLKWVMIAMMPWVYGSGIVRIANSVLSR